MAWMLAARIAHVAACHRLAKDPATNSVHICHAELQQRVTAYLTGESGGQQSLLGGPLLASACMPACPSKARVFAPHLGLHKRHLQYSS